MRFVHFFLLFCSLLLQNCRSLPPAHRFDAAVVPPAPDYSKLENWAAHPEKSDPSDRTPKDLGTPPAQDAGADVFFLHPTTLTGDRKSKTRRAWNAHTNDPLLNKKTEETTILYQASIFNAVGRVFAPRYRQAHLKSFFSRDTASARRALALAYDDVRAAFDYYLKNYHDGQRPIVVAGHSQGGAHGIRLVQEFFDGKPLSEHLAVAYLVGWPVSLNSFKNILPCQNAEQTGCFCSWRTFEREFGIRKNTHSHVICTNPILWTTESGKFAPRTESKGAVLTNFERVFPQLADAEVHNGILLCSKPRFPGSFFLRTKNYHAGDFNLYYLDVRANAVLRVQKMSEKKHDKN